MHIIGDIHEMLGSIHIKLLRDLQMVLKSQSMEMTEKELLKALIEFAAEQKRLFIKSLDPPEEKSPLERWLEKIVTKDSSEKKERYSSV